MAGVLPNSFLFRYAFPVRYAERVTKAGGRHWPFGVAGEFQLPSLSELDDTNSFARVFLTWNSDGIGVAAEVSGKTQAVVCNLNAAAESDGLQVWIDTRDTQSIHRASRYCHHFCLLPAGGGKNGKQPCGVQLPIARSREETPMADPGDIRVTAKTTDNGYRLEAWLPADILNGYDPDANPRLGFYYALRDAELGQQHLTVGPEFPFAHDPSLWSTLELER